MDNLWVVIVFCSLERFCGQIQDLRKKWCRMVWSVPKFKDFGLSFRVFSEREFWTISALCPFSVVWRGFVARFRINAKNGAEWCGRCPNPRFLARVLVCMPEADSEITRRIADARCNNQPKSKYNYFLDNLANPNPPNN